jgi:excinuclease ABC subunit B
MYADKITNSMRKAIDETNRRRTIQDQYNKDNNIIPKTILKSIHERISIQTEAKKEVEDFNKLSQKDVLKNINMLEKQMYVYAKELDFERAAEIRDVIFELKGYLK